MIEHESGFSSQNSLDSADIPDRTRICAANVRKESPPSNNWTSNVVV